MALESSRRLKVKHERLWADKLIACHYRLPVMNGICAFQATDPGTSVIIHCIKVHLLSSDQELHDLRERRTSELEPLVHGGTPNRTTNGAAPTALKTVVDGCTHLSP